MYQYNKVIQKMINFNDTSKENIKEYNPNWPQILDHPYRILIIGGSGSGKTNSFINLINQLLLNTPVIWMIFMRTLKNTTLMKNVKH